MKQELKNYSTPELLQELEKRLTANTNLLSLSEILTLAIILIKLSNPPKKEKCGFKKSPAT